MANLNSIPDLSNTASSNINYKGQSIRGTALASTIDSMFQNNASMLADFYDSLGGVATVSGTDTYTVTITEDWAALASGLILAVKIPNANTGAATLNVTVPTAGALGAKAIRRQGDSALSANDMLANGIYLLRYASTYNAAAGAWVLLNPAGADTSTLLPKSGGTMTGDLALSTSTNVTTSPPLQFSGDANTGIGHSAADTLDFVTAGVDAMQITSTGARKSVIPSGSTLYPLFDCRSWVNFNGTGTVAIRGSGNISSITDNGTGDYTANFSTAFADANYGVAAIAGAAALNTVRYMSIAAAPTSSACRVNVFNGANTLTDTEYVLMCFTR